jgi:RHH-type transcriptional regulator, rel operon repressor / antitoxin RelB
MPLLYTYSKGRLMLALRLPEDLEARLDALARKTGRTKSYYAREALVEYIDDLEDLYLAQTRYALIEKGKSKTLSLDDAEAQIGLDR